MSKEQEKDLVWVSKELAERIKNVNSEEHKIKIFDEYIKKLTVKSREEFEQNLENLEEDVAIYVGLMLRVKKAFKEAKEEQLEASYQLWEKFGEEMPYIEEKIEKVIEEINPVSKKAEELEKAINRRDYHRIEKVTDAILKLSNLWGKEKDMITFLVNNFKENNNG